MAPGGTAVGVGGLISRSDLIKPTRILYAEEHQRQPLRKPFA